MKILIAGTGIALLQRELAGLRQEVHSTVLVENGHQAIDAYFEETPDVTLLATQLEGIDGYEAARIIKNRAGEHSAPVILAPPALDHEALLRFKTSQADDCMPSPITASALLIKVEALRRCRKTQAVLERFKARAEHEIGLAHGILQRIIEHPNQDVPEVESWSWPAGHFAGDLIAHRVSPSGRIYAMLVDSAGHGLAAAVATIPTAIAFYDLVDEGKEVADIAQHINHRLHRLLPTGHFCAAGIVELNPDTKTLTCWNGGLPPMLLLDERLNVIDRIHSTSPPLGILPSLDCAGDVTRLSHADFHSLLAYSDGLTESAAPDGSLFGEAVLEASLARAGSPDRLIARLREDIVSFNASLEPQDDISILSIRPSGASASQAHRARRHIGPLSQHLPLH